MRNSRPLVGQNVEEKGGRQVQDVVKERPLRILMIAPTSFFSDYGGHIRILEETRILHALGHEVAIVTYYKGSDMPGLDIRRTAPLPWHTDYEVGSSRHKIVFDLYLAWQALREGVRYRPDVIHGHMHEGALIGGVLAKLLRVPLVFDFQGSLTGEMVDHNFLDENGRIYKIAYWLEKQIDRLPNAILTSSVKATRLLEEEFAVPAQHIYPLPDCADPVRFNPDNFSEAEKIALKQQLGLPLDCPIIAYLGLLTNYQGIPQLLQVAAQLKQADESFHLLLMGYPDVNYYREVAQQLGVADKVTFTGKVEYRDAPFYLSLGDISVAPKMSLTEGSGKLLNYMALGQAVVAFDTAVHREYLADLGVYAPMGDVEAFAKGIQSLLHHPQKREILGQKLRERAIHVYSWRKAGEEIVSLYKQLTK